MKDILTAKRDPKAVFKDVRAMRELIAQEKGDDDPWDLKLARGGLTDLDFIAQGLVLAHAQEHPTLVGLSTEATFAEAQLSGCSHKMTQGHSSRRTVSSTTSSNGSA